MKRLIIIAMAFVMAMSGTALADSGAGAHEAALRPGGATCTPPGGNVGGGDPVGFVVMNSAGKPGEANDLIFNVQLKDGAPNTTYEVRVHKAGDPVNCPNAGGGQPVQDTFTTNKKGHGHANFKVEGLDSAGPSQSYFITLNEEGSPVPPAEYSSDAAALD